MERLKKVIKKIQSSIDKRILSSIATRNTSIFISTIFFTISFIRDVDHAYYWINRNGTLMDIHYTLFGLKLYGTDKVYDIHNYAILFMILGVIYNIQVKIRSKKYKKDDIEL